MLDTFEDIKNKANSVRHIDLKAILNRTGSMKDKFDKAKWHTSQGVITVTGHKFMNWTQATGGGGAIDLVINLKKCDFKTAVFWLSENFSSSAIQTSQWIKPVSKQIFTLPKRDDNKVPQIMRYLRYERCIPPKLINFLIRSGTLYADNRGNAVFLLLGKDKRVVGAELRGTTHLRWHGMAPGSRKELGAFYVKSPNTKKMVICESAIDAISYFALQLNCLALSTSGANSNPPWLSSFISKGFKIYCGFDSDETGDILAIKMINLYPAVRRLRPTKHDWNEVLQSKLKPS